jgi:ribosomal-protein-alanine N-acetyltransferase
MLKRVLEDGVKLGIEAFTLEVRRGNLPAVRLYEKFGFAQEGVRRDFYENPREDALIMWKRQESDGTITTVFTNGVHV